MKTCIEERNLVSEFERRIITTRYTDNFSTVHVASHACMYCYRPMSALTSQQREGALPLENACICSASIVYILVTTACTGVSCSHVRLEMFTCPAPDIVTGMNNRISARTDWLSRERFCY